MIFSQILFKFFDPNSECFVKYDAFCLHIFDYACLWRKTYCYQRGSNYGKIVYIKNTFENSWWEDAYSYPIPLDPPLAISYKNHQQNLAYFSHLRGHGTIPLSLKCAQSSRRRGAKRLSTGGAKSKIKQKSRCLQKSKLFKLGGRACRLGGHDPPLAPALNTLSTALHLFRDMIMIEKESIIAFSAIDKLVALL